MTKKRYLQFLAAFLIVTVLAAGIGVPLALAEGVPIRPFTTPNNPGCQSNWDAAINTTVAEAYGMTTDDVVTGLQHGATLAELAPTQRQLLALQAELVLQRNERIDQAVADGVISEDLGDTLKLLVPQTVNFLVTNGGGPYWGQGGNGGRIWGLWRDTAASYLDMSVEEMAEALLAGDSLGDVADAQGADVDGLVDALLAGIQERLDQAVTSGLLTPEQADRISAGLHTAVSRFIYTSGPCSNMTPTIINR